MNCANYCKGAPLNPVIEPQKPSLIESFNKLKTQNQESQGHCSLRFFPENINGAGHYFAVGNKKVLCGGDYDCTCRTRIDDSPSSALIPIDSKSQPRQVPCLKSQLKISFGGSTAIQRRAKPDFSSFPSDPNSIVNWLLFEMIGKIGLDPQKVFSFVRLIP